MRFPSLLLALALLAGCVTTSEQGWRGYTDDERMLGSARSGVIVIEEGKGGSIIKTATLFGQARLAGSRFRVEGLCYSACTLLLMDVLADSVCWEPEALFLFHAAREGQGPKSEEGTLRLLQAMPDQIRRLLPPPEIWTMGAWLPISGRQAAEALGRGLC